MSAVRSAYGCPLHWFSCLLWACCSLTSPAWWFRLTGRSVSLPSHSAAAAAEAEARAKAIADKKAQDAANRAAIEAKAKEEAAAKKCAPGPSTTFGARKLGVLTGVSAQAMNRLNEHLRRPAQGC